jgi:glucan phosphoethanolaminetransferase (alkaline phosphatase superfamily)
MIAGRGGRIATNSKGNRLLVHVGAIVAGATGLWLFFGLSKSTYCFYVGLLATLLGLFVVVHDALRSPIHGRLLKPLYLMAGLIVILVAAIHADNVLSYGPLVADTVHAIYQTSLLEAADYLRLYWSWPAIAWAGSWALLFIVSLLLVPDGARRAPRTKWTGVALLALGPALVFLGKRDALMIYGEARAYAGAIRSFEESRRGILERHGLAGMRSDFDGTIIVVIGESSARQHFGLYGYVRDTTPRLAKRLPRLQAFTDVISTHSLTMSSLTEALTLTDRDTPRHAGLPVDIFTLFRAAGFRTAWLSNQNAIGVWENPIAALARQADQVKYHDRGSDVVRAATLRSGSKYARTVYDEAMVPSIRQLVAGDIAPKKLLFVHLMATHWPYCDVVPPGFTPDLSGSEAIAVNAAFLGRYFAEADSAVGALVDCYDRAVRYVDFVLDQIIEIAEAQATPSLVVYFADHGEAPLLGSGHEPRRHSHFHIEIPFLVWANDAYRDRYPERLKIMARNRTRPGSLVDFSYALADIAGLSSVPGVQVRSIFSPGYESHSRTSLLRRLKYDAFDPVGDYVERARANLRALTARYGARANKVWAHRVNTIGALLEAKEVFPGVEFDVVFDPHSAQFFVGKRPPAPNVNLSLATQLRQDDGERRYWLDWKNASPGNVPQALASLNELDARHRLKHRVIVETTDPAAGRPIAAAGWLASYYLPTGDVLACMAACADAEQLALARRLEEKLRDNDFAAMSFDAQLLPFFRRYLSGFATARGIRVFTWDMRIDVSSAGAVVALGEYIEDDVIDVVLVPFPSVFGL